MYANNVKNAQVDLFLKCFGKNNQPPRFQSIFKNIDWEFIAEHGSSAFAAKYKAATQWAKELKNYKIFGSLSIGDEVYTAHLIHASFTSAGKGNWIENNQFPSKWSLKFIWCFQKFLNSKWSQGRGRKAKRHFLIVLSRQLVHNES